MWVLARNHVSDGVKFGQTHLQLQGVTIRRIINNGIVGMQQHGLFIPQ